MAKTKGKNTNSGPALLDRLPPGRHGLSREFVTENQRSRLTVGMISAVAQKGYNETTITDISKQAGVSRRTFYKYFESKEGCFFATLDLIADHLKKEAEEAGSAETVWEKRVRREMLAVLEVFAANPDLVTCCVIAPQLSDAGLAERYREASRQAFVRLTRGAPEANQPTEDQVEFLIGATSSIIARKVIAGEGKQLPELFPDLVKFILAPYIGGQAAARLAGT